MAHKLDLNDPRVVRILELETLRQEAYLTRDFKKLEILFGPDVAYVHSTGKVDDLKTYLANVVNVPEFLSIEHPELGLRFLGERGAVMTGLLRTHIRRPGGEEEVAESYLTQVWELQADGWRQVLYQLTRVHS